MRDDLIDEEEVEESKALTDVNIDPRFVENLRGLAKTAILSDYADIWAHAARAAAETIDRKMIEAVGAAPVHDGWAVPKVDEAEAAAAWEKEYFEQWPKLAALQQRLQQQKDADLLAAQWEEDFRNMHPELRGLISAGILILNGTDNIGFPGNELIFNASGGLICRGTCIKPWGNPGDHKPSCPYKWVIPYGVPGPQTQTTTPITTPPLCQGTCCKPKTPHHACGQAHSTIVPCPPTTFTPPTISGKTISGTPYPVNPATSPIGHPVDTKKAAGWKGHEHYGYDSDVD